MPIVISSPHSFHEINRSITHGSQPERKDIVLSSKPVQTGSSCWIPNGCVPDG